MLIDREREREKEREREREGRPKIQNIHWPHGAREGTKNKSNFQLGTAKK